MNTPGSKPCPECGKPVDPVPGKIKLFCCDRCRYDNTNRRKLRGAELYDLFMAMRYDRANAKIFGVWAIMCRMAAMWREEDLRTGVRSFAPIREVLERHIRYVATRHRVSKRGP